ncbi:MAG: thiolase domain-containing protein [Chloroflexota bacterium]|nr:thiolase domain-containing protein [Chloroflexota bacterium]
MRSVYIAGYGQTPVGEQWQRSLRHLAHDAIMPAMQDAGIERADALYVGNMLSGELVGQEHLGALVADFVGLRGIEAIKVEAACGSGAAALRMGYIAVAGGIHDVVIVAGVEKMTDTVSKDTTAALAMAADQEYEAAEGVSFVALNAMLMRRYMHVYDVPHSAFGYFAVNAHQNAVGNPNAMFRRAISLDTYLKAPMICEPINLMDSSPICDGAAAVVLMSEHLVRSMNGGRRPVRIAGSAAGTDSLAIHDRRDPLWLEAAWISSQKAYQQAGITPADVDLFELHDAFTIMAALSLEASGFAERGQGVRLAQEGEITIEGRVPVATMGGLKARGHPVGATGVYQIVEAAQQVQGLAGPNQVHDVDIALVQNIGGSGATIVSHILIGE